jgi:hypothetical protein
MSLRSIRITPPQTVFYPFKGGMDLMTPAIALDPGKVFDAQNYLPEISGGYRRCYGHERSDGRPSPSAANYWLADTAGGLMGAVGDTIVGVTSGATAKVLATPLPLFGGTKVLGRVTGTFTAGEVYTVGGLSDGATISTVPALNSADTASDDADYKLLAADDRRADIAAVPGSGISRGGFIYNDVVYAFRDNAGATAGDLYKQTAGGWVKVNFGTEIQFTGAVGEVLAGNTITGLTSGATATVVRPMLRAGAWTAAGVGTLIITVTAGTFQSGEALQVGGVTKVTSSSLATAITRAPGGKVRTVKANFTGSTATQRVYGADGVNKAFEFDGTNYIPIRTGMTTDTPAHVIAHRGYLWLSFLGSAQYSGVLNPYAWTAVLGAGEIAVGETITGFQQQAGDASGPALSIFTDNTTHTFYGLPGVAGAQLVPGFDDTGYLADTIQTVGNDSWGLTSRGVQALRTTRNYGDFEYGAISFPVQTLINSKRGLSCSSVVNKSNSDYRLFFTDGTGVVIGLTGNKVSGILPLNYGARIPRWFATDTLSTGQEVTYFGSDDGMVYKDNTGTSFDGDEIEAWIWTAFNNLGSPRLRKTYRRAIFEIKCDGYASVNATYDLGYATPNVTPAAAQSDQALAGAGGYWGQFTWDAFTWDTQLVADAQISIDGTENNIAFLFYSNRAQDASHVVQGVTLLYSPRRLVHAGS